MYGVWNMECKCDIFKDKKITFRIRQCDVKCSENTLSFLHTNFGSGEMDLKPLNWDKLIYH